LCYAGGQPPTRFAFSSTVNAEARYFTLTKQRASPVLAFDRAHTTQEHHALFVFVKGPAFWWQDDESPAPFLLQNAETGLRTETTSHSGTGGTFCRHRTPFMHTDCGMLLQKGRPRCNQPESLLQQRLTSGSFPPMTKGAFPCASQPIPRLPELSLSVLKCPS
jgi:hypothetical protein